MHGCEPHLIELRSRQEQGRDLSGAPVEQVPGIGTIRTHRADDPECVIVRLAPGFQRSHRTYARASQGRVRWRNQRRSTRCACTRRRRQSLQLPKLLWVNPQLTSHLYVRMRQVKPASRLDPRLQVGRYLCLFLRHSLGSKTACAVGPPIPSDVEGSTDRYRCGLCFETEIPRCALDSRMAQERSNRLQIPGAFQNVESLRST